LSDWLHVRHAIQLHQLLDSNPPAFSTKKLNLAVPLRAELDQMLGDLRAAMLHDRFVNGLWRNPMPEAMILLPVVWDELWEPYRRCLSDHQKQMSLWLGRWRKKARSALMAAGGELQKLALMDAVFEQSLHDKEARLLSTLPARMGQHLARCVAQHLPGPQDQAEQRTAISPAWLKDFENDLRSGLIAELELRIQPLLGLMEALESKTT
jgi:hypothetical protein